jgi:hypothetical protein
MFLASAWYLACCMSRGPISSLLYSENVSMVILPFELEELSAP